jgi:hypothetical protein
VEVSTLATERELDRARKLLAAVERIQQAATPGEGDRRIRDSDRQRVIEAAAARGPNPPDNLSRARRRIWDVLTESPVRMVTKEVLEALAKRHGTISEGMVKQDLAVMVEFGLLDNRQDTNPPGYGIAGKSYSS